MLQVVREKFGVGDGAVVKALDTSRMVAGLRSDMLDEFSQFT
jgi:hypothetical protein